MEIYFTVEATIDINRKFFITEELSDGIQAYFTDKGYSPDLEYLYICLSCLNPSFAAFYPRRLPKYTTKTRKYIYQGTELEKKAKTYEYELRLDFEIYNKLPDIRQQLANDVINSLDGITECKKIDPWIWKVSKTISNNFFK